MAGWQTSKQGIEGLQTGRLVLAVWQVSRQMLPRKQKVAGWMAGNQTLAGRHSDTLAGKQAGKRWMAGRQACRR
jgi:hypothetical protein